MIIGTPLGCGCFGADAPVVPVAPAVPVVVPTALVAKPKRVRGAGPRLVNPYDIMRSGRTPYWYGKDPRYALTNVAELVRRATQP
jgi:hypothetical protein